MLRTLLRQIRRELREELERDHIPLAPCGRRALEQENRRLKEEIFG